MYVVYVELRSRNVVLLERHSTKFNVVGTYGIRCEMTSVDSGVETGNDSNDSSITQHESLTTNQIGSVSSAVATTASSTKEVHENEPGTFRIEFGPVWPVGLCLPISSLCPDHYNCTGHDPSSTPTSSSGPVVCSNEVLECRLPSMHNSNGLSITMELLKQRSSYRRKMIELQRDFRSFKNNHYISWCDGLMKRKMRLAAATNNIIYMRTLLSNGISPNNHDELGRTPLHLASGRGYTEMVHLLLEHGADPNKRDCKGNTPLHLAAVTSKISVVTLLLKAGTDVLSLDKYGYNPLQLAQTKLWMLQTYKGLDMVKIKEEVHNVISMLIAYLQKQKDAQEKVETLSTFCSRLSLSNTSDQIQDDVKDLLANLNALTITS